MGGKNKSVARTDLAGHWHLHVSALVVHQEDVLRLEVRVDQLELVQDLK